MRGGLVRAAVPVRTLVAADPHVLAPNHAPTPFLAEEIRVGCPVGRTIKLLVEVEGAEPFVRVQRYVWANERGSTTERWRESVNGVRVGPVEDRDSTWRRLQENASFPADRTTIEPDTIDIPIGVVDCLRYTVRDGEKVQRLWFARHLPGMPVKVVVKEEGRVISTVTMISNEFA